MSLKTSSSNKFFSKAIIKADLKNHWGWPVIAGVLMLFNLFTVLDSYYILNYFDRIKQPYTWLDMADRLFGEYYFTFFAGIVFSILLGAKLFFYLDKVNSVSCMHGMPFTRKKLFFSHIISGGILVMMPAVFITLAMMILKIFLPQSIFRIDICLAFLLAYAVYSFIAFAISVFTMTVSGNVLVSLAYCGCIIVLPISVVSFVEYLCETQIYGYVSGGFVEKVFEYLYLVPNNLYPFKFIIYIILGTALFVAAYFIYKVRPLENCEEVMAFRKFRWLFIALVGFILGMISYVFFVDMLSGESLLWMLPLGLVGTVAASMFARKSISLKGSFKYVGAYVLIALVCSLSLEYDLFGYERRIPSASSIESVYVDYYSRNYYYFEYDREMPDYHITEPDEIELVRELHKAYLTEKGNYYTGRSYDSSMYRKDDVSLVYKLKNGMTVKRRYYNLSSENFDKYLKPVLDTDTMKSREYPLLDSVEKEILNITVYDNRIYTPAVTYTDTENLEKLCDALKYDINNNSYSELYETGALSLSIEFYVPGSKQYGGKLPTNVSEKYETASSNRIYLNRNFKETLRVLEEIGYEVHSEKEIDKIEKLTIAMLEDYEKINYEYEHATKDIVGSVLGYSPESSAAYTETKTVTVTDKNDIEEFYKLCGTGFLTDMNSGDERKVLECEFIFLDSNYEVIDENTVFAVGAELIVEDLPENLQKYFK
ncbi:MAG: hypothetical protein E7621_07440 [Ruminococcaceae bacterium]|nr:hypothetical protein [Oscillospiraceae bacterium]